ncbi:MAG: hypothetical protein RSC04_03105, partial [Bacteroidales bacterium]
NSETSGFITNKEIAQATGALQEKYKLDNVQNRIVIGVKQVAETWRETDGTPTEFVQFCVRNFEADSTQLDVLFQKLSRNLELLFGYHNKMSVDLKIPLHVSGDEITNIDELFGGLNPSAHFTDDMYASKIAFVCLLNFPRYSLTEKNAQGGQWSRQQWAYARMGDVFGARIPALLSQKFAQLETESDSYISDYNICMEGLVKGKKKDFFAPNTHLITHWGLRDELKSQYGQKEGLEKQKLIYQVMKRIISQDIPSIVINNANLEWDPYTNKVSDQGKLIETLPEANVRYEYLVKFFGVAKEMDTYYPMYPSYIQRVFDLDMELGQKEVEKLFTTLLSSEQIKKTANLIAKRLGRKLEAYDIWYAGFKVDNEFSEAQLDQLTKEKYPTTQAFKADLPRILMQLGFTPQKADSICSKITVDASRGAGHAWEAKMKGDNARLRTRVGADGMNYKGYNIAVHEFGHNVEQTLSLYDIDYYMLCGVPTTAFTEALAFMFQVRNLDLLGVSAAKSEESDDLECLQTLWSTYEIMGVSLVDIRVWEWMYAHPNCNAAELKEAVIRIAQEVWNTYYAPVFGKKDEPILAIYSHMIIDPLYLSSYPIGHLIDFQLEQAVKEKNFANTIMPWFEQGKLTPKWWMKKAVQKELSVQAILDAAEGALEKIK